QSGILVDLEPHAMTGRMNKIPVQFGTPQTLSAGVIYVACGSTGPNCGNARQLRFQHRVIHAARLWRRPSDVHSTRHVGTITVEYNTVVENHEPTVGYARHGGHAMRQRGSRSTGNDRLERHRFR